jgi:transaldolase
VDLDALAAKLQDEGAAAFVASWHELLGVVAAKRAAIEGA